MRRDDRVRTLAGGAIVLAAMVGAGFALTVHPSAPPPREATADDGTVPGDLVWSVLASCATSGGTFRSIGLGDDGRLTVDVGTDAGQYDEDATAIENACLAQYRIQADARNPFGANQATRAQTILLADYADRWLRPCLAGHGFPLLRIPWEQAGLDGRMAWDRYSELSAAPLEKVLAARRACGSGSDLLSAAGHG